jgi:Domain of unknown function (DUF397)
MNADPTSQTWRRSSYSTGSGGNCVEVAASLPGPVAVRDSKDPAGPVLFFTPAGWSAFLGAVKDGELSVG